MAKSIYGQACSTKAKRAKLAEAIKVIARECGATVVVDRDTGYLNDKEHLIALAFGDYRVSMDFDGVNDCGAFLAHWYTDSSSSAKYPKNFGYTCSGSINEVHYAKATTCCDDFESFKHAIQSGLKRIAELVIKITPEYLIELAGQTINDDGYGSRETKEAERKLAQAMREGGVKLLQELIAFRQQSADASEELEN